MEQPTLAPIRALLVGYGYAGRTFHAPLIDAAAAMVLAGIVSSDAQKVHADFPGVPVFASIDAAFADQAFDVVVIATPDRLHAEGAHRALDHGAAVVIDKPFAHTLEEAQTLVERLGNRENRLFVFHNRRYDSDFLTLKRLIDENALGQIHLFESRFDRFRPVVRDRWRETPGAGVFNDLSPHLIDQALCLFGKPDAVFADIAIMRAGGQADDDFGVQLYYPRLRVRLSASMVTPGAGLRMRVDGDKAAYIKYALDHQESQLQGGMSPQHSDFGIDPEPGVLIDGASTVTSRPAAERGQYVAYYEAVAGAIRGTCPSPVSPGQALLVMRIMQIARTSADQQRVLSVPETW